MDFQAAVDSFSAKLDHALGLLVRTKGPDYDSPRPVVLARVEDERSDFPADQRIPRSLFADLVATYDPERRTAPVVVGFFDEGGSALTQPSGSDRVVAGPSHWVGEYLPPLGFIRGEDGPDGWHLDHDHLNLFGMVRQIIDQDGTGRVDRMVSRGFLQRSIAYVPKTNETGGKPDLWHFAVLGGEQPGIPNMPSLARTFGLGLEDRAREWQALGLTARGLREVNYRTLSILDDLKETAMTPEERTALAKELAGAMGAVIAPLAESINKATETQQKAFVDLSAKVEAKVATIDTKVDTAKEDAKKAADQAAAERRKRISERMLALVKSGRCQPAQLERVARKIAEPSTPDEAIDAALEALEALPVRDAEGRTPTEIKVEGQAPAFIDFQERYTIPGLRQELDPEQVETMSQLMASVLHFPFAERKAALNRAIEAHYGGPSASGLGF